MTVAMHVIVELGFGRAAVMHPETFGWAAVGARQKVSGARHEGWINGCEHSVLSLLMSLNIDNLSRIVLAHAMKS